MAVNPTRRDSKAYKTDEKKDLDLHETIKHIDRRIDIERKERDKDFDRCERSIRSFESKITSLTGPRYWNSSFWDHHEKSKKNSS